MISLVWRATYANGDGTNVLRDSKFKYEFIELLKIACQRNEWVSKCIGFDNESKRDWSVGTNRRVRQVRDRFTKGANNDEILIISISPLVLAWHTTYADGDDKDAITHCNDGEGGGGTSQGEFDIDTIDTIDNDKNGIIGNDAATDTITATDSSPISEERQTWRAIHHGFASRKDFNGIAAILLRIVLLLTLQVRSDLKACSVSSPTERLLSRYFSNQVAP
jgi:hypothetical protein